MSLEPLYFYHWKGRYLRQGNYYNNTRINNYQKNNIPLSICDEIIIENDNLSQMMS